MIGATSTGIVVVTINIEIRLKIRKQRPVINIANTKDIFLRGLPYTLSVPCLFRIVLAPYYKHAYAYNIYQKAASLRKPPLSFALPMLCSLKIRPEVCILSLSAISSSAEFISFIPIRLTRPVIY